MSKNRILVVEDDPAISDGIAVNLLYSGYDHVLFRDGNAAAQALLQDHSFDLALLDIMLPGLDGFALFEHVKKYNIPVIFITAKTDSASEIKGLLNGAEDYIVKPFEVMTLLVRIEKVLNRAGKLDQILRFSDITIDLQEHTVRRDEAEILLKPMEFEVLVLLVRHKNRTIPRDKILNEVWGTDFFGDTRTVDVHIANIRKKLGVDGLIKTIPKYGYRLEG